jgi:hypothetical protein
MSFSNIANHLIVYRVSQHKKYCIRNLYVRRSNLRKIQTLERHRIV